MAKKTVKIIRVRCNSESCEVITKRALKLGATRIGSRTVSPTHVEAFAEFSKNALAKEFEAWIRRAHKESIFIDDAS